MKKIILLLVLFILPIAYAAEGMFECEPQNDCILYEFVLNNGEPCSDCEVNISISYPNATWKENGTFTYMLDPGHYRYNAGLLTTTGYYEITIVGYNSTGDSAYSDNNLIDVQASNDLTANYSHQSIVPQIDTYIPLALYIMLLAIAFISVIIGYYIDLYPLEVFGFFMLFFSGVLAISGNVIYVTDESFMPFTGWIATWSGIFMVIASIAGWVNVYMVRRLDRDMED